MSEQQQKLVLSIIDFLNQSIKDGTVKESDTEGLEVAIQCIGEAFGVDPSDEQQTQRLSIQPSTLPSIFDVYLKTRARVGSSSAPPAPAAPSAADKAAAESLKQAGNAHMSGKRYTEALAAYSDAIAKDPTNAVYFSNRAAAHSSLGDHASAVADAESAIRVDPAFTKAFSRLGHAHYSMGDFRAAADAFRRGLAVDPSNANLKSSLQNAEARIVPDDDDVPPLESDARSTSPPSTGAGAGGLPDLAGMANMLRGMGGAGGGGGGAGGGMPDIASLMQNPMLMQMAQQMMQGGGMEQLMSNPAVANMMNRAQSGGGMPSMEEIMADPTLRDLASQIGGMGGIGGGAGAGR